MRQARAFLFICAGLFLLMLSYFPGAGKAAVQPRRRAAQTRAPVASAPQNDVVAGQVFIVMKSGESVKMGLVTVQLLPLDSLLQYLAAKKPEVAGRRARLQSELDLANATLSQAGANYATAKKEREDAEQVSENWKAYLDSGIYITTTELKRARAVMEEEVRRLEVERTHIDYFRYATIMRDSLDGEMNSCRAGQAYFQELPHASAMAQTDADGRFTMTVPRSSEFALAAQAQRQVGEKIEAYYWMFRLPDEARHGTLVFLSNETLTTGTSPLSLIGRGD